LRGSTMKTMGQRAHHLGTSPAPALPNPLLRRGIGASSLPAPPLVTTRAGPGELARGPTLIASAAQVCSTRSAGAGAHHTEHGSVRTDERHRQPLCRDLLPRGARPVAGAPGQHTTAVTHNCSSATFDSTSGPGGPAGFQRQDGIGRRLLGKGRRVRSVIPAGRGQRTAKNKWAPPIMDGMLRTVARSDRRCTPENQHLYLRVF
jgi:hypothetical protein